MIVSDSVKEGIIVGVLDGCFVMVAVLLDESEGIEVVEVADNNESSCCEHADKNDKTTRLKNVTIGIKKVR